MNEFDLIARYFSQIGTHNVDVALGVRDDCAIINVRPGHQLCTSIDTLVEGVHFPKNISPFALGWRALAVCISDLAAMGAEPSHFTLALTFSSPEPSWLSEFARGLSALAEKYSCPLVGGDTTKGPLCISIQVAGWVPSGAALQRSKAQPGDLLCVSGALGGASAALDLLPGFEGRQVDVNNMNPGADKALLERYLYPEPQIKLGKLLRGAASSAIDISDGLLSEAGHIARLSGVGLEIDLNQLPLNEALRKVGVPNVEQFKLACGGGDDYELLFTLPARHHERVHKDFDISIIGRVIEGAGVSLQGEQILVNNLLNKPGGYQHFE